MMMMMMMRLTGACWARRGLQARLGLQAQKAPQAPLIPNARDQGRPKASLSAGALRAAADAVGGSGASDRADLP